MYNKGSYYVRVAMQFGIFLIPVIFFTACSGEVDHSSSANVMPLSIEEKESYEDDSIYMVAYEIQSKSQIFRFEEEDKQSLLDYSAQRFKSDRTSKGDLEIHYYFYEPGSKIPPFSKIKDFNRVENLLWVDLKSFDSPFMEWTNSLVAEGELYEWKID